MLLFKYIKKEFEFRAILLLFNEKEMRFE